MSTNARIRVMLVDDHSIMRDGLRQVLEQTGEFEVVGNAGDGEEAVRTIQTIKPDVIIMDVIMPRMDGIEACREVMDMLPDTRVLMLTASNEEESLVQSIAAGATGYLQKYSGMEQLLATVRDVAGGEFRIPADAAKHLFAAIHGSAQVDDKEARGLTAKEREILTLFAQGMTYAQIAEVIGNTRLTIRNSIYRIQNKLGIRTKQGIVVWAVRNGLLDDYVQLADPRELGRAQRRTKTDRVCGSPPQTDVFANIRMCRNTIHPNKTYQALQKSPLRGTSVT